MAIDPRNGAPKRLTPVAIHPGMTNSQRAGMGQGGRGHAVVEDGGVNSLQHAYGSVIKDRPDAPIAHGMKEVTTYGHIDGNDYDVKHTSEFGRSLLNAATKSGSTHLPAKIKEN